jgi:hypothetical protein
MIQCTIFPQADYFAILLFILFGCGVFMFYERFLPSAKGSSDTAKTILVKKTCRKLFTKNQKILLLSCGRVVAGLSAAKEKILRTHTTRETGFGDVDLRAFLGVALGQSADLGRGAGKKRIDGPPGAFTKSQTHPHPPTCRLFASLDFFFGTFFGVSRLGAFKNTIKIFSRGGVGGKK